MATEKIGIEVEVKGAEKTISSFKDLKTAIKAAKDEQIAMTEKFGASSEQATKAGQKLAGLKDKVEDLNDSTKSLKGSGIEKLTSSFRLLGEGIGTFDFDKIKTGFKGIGTAMGAIPIFLIISGLTLLIQNFDKVKTVVENLIPGFKSVSKFIGGIVTSITDFIGITSDATRAVDALRQSADKQLAVNKKYLQEHGDQVNKYTAQKIDAKNRYLEAIKEDGANVAALGQRLNRELANIDKQRLDDSKKVNVKSLDDSKKTNNDKVTDAKDAAKEKLLIELELQGKLKELQTQLIKDEEVKEQTILKNKFLADQKDLYNKGANAELLKALNDNFEKDKLDISNKFKKIKEDKEKQDNDKFISEQQGKASKLLSTLESQYQLELEQIEGNDLLKLQKEQEHVDEVYRINVASANLIKESTTNLDNKYAQDKIALEKRIAAETKKIKQAEIAQGFENIKNGLQSAQNLSDLYFTIKSAKVKKGSKEEEDLARKQFDINKKLNLAMATINGVQAIQAILATAVDPTGITTALRIAASATLSAVNIAKIASAQFEGGGGTPTAEAPTSITSAPTSQAPAIYGPGQGQSTTFSGNQNNNFAPVKAYVVETENRSTTNRVNKLVSESTYG